MGSLQTAMWRRVLTFLTFIVLSSGLSLSCGRSEPVSSSVSRQRRTTLTFRYTPFCASTWCLLQRAAGLGLLGMAVFLALYKHKLRTNRRGRRDLAEAEHLCNFLLLKPDEIFTNRICYESSSKVIEIQDKEYEVEEDVTFPSDKFSVLLKLRSPVLKDHIQPCSV